MELANWRERVKAYIEDAARPVDKYGHQPRLYALACEIAGDPEIAGQCDDDVVFAAAWMHDLGVFTGHRPANPEELARWNHVPYTVAKSRDLLLEWGFPAEKLDKVGEVIETHQPQDEPRIPEAVVVRDADMLEQLGAIGLLRAFTKVGRDTRFSRFTDVVPVAERAQRELPGRLRLGRTRELARARISIVEIFLKGLGDEAGGSLY